jgi:GH18 family chitinase
MQFLYNTARTTVVTYDDTYSLGDKAAYAKSSGMGGCFTWALDQAGLTLYHFAENIDGGFLCACNRTTVPPFNQPFAPNWEFD